MLCYNVFIELKYYNILKNSNERGCRSKCRYIKQSNWLGSVLQLLSSAKFLL